MDNTFAVVRNKCVWVLDDATPQCMAVSVRDYIARKSYYGKSICVLGDRKSAALTHALITKRNNLASLSVITPLVCKTAKQRNNPACVLYAMRDFKNAPSLGGRHEIMPHEYAAYEIAAMLDAFSSNEPTSETMPVHCLCNYLEWLPVNRAACNALIGTIIDPRWYINLRSPNSSSKLYKFLGLDPDTIAYVIGIEDSKPASSVKHCRLVLNCWFDPKYAQIIMQGSQDKTIALVEQTLENPSWFLWRIWLKHQMTTANPEIAHIKAALRTSQRFISFIRALWLGLIYPHNTELQFDPHMFFHKNDVAAAFIAYCRGLSDCAVDKENEAS